VLRGIGIAADGRAYQSRPRHSMASVVRASRRRTGQPSVWMTVRITVMVSVGEQGQGSETIFAQIAA